MSKYNFFTKVSKTIWKNTKKVGRSFYKFSSKALSKAGKWVLRHAKYLFNNNKLQSDIQKENQSDKLDSNNQISNDYLLNHKLNLLNNKLRIHKNNDLLNNKLLIFYKENKEDLEKKVNDLKTTKERLTHRLNELKLKNESTETDEVIKVENELNKVTNEFNTKVNDLNSLINSIEYLTQLITSNDQSIDTITDSINELNKQFSTNTKDKTRKSIFRLGDLNNKVNSSLASLSIIPELFTGLLSSIGVLGQPPEESTNESKAKDDEHNLPDQDTVDGYDPNKTEVGFTGVPQMTNSLGQVINPNLHHLPSLLPNIATRSNNIYNSSSGNFYTYPNYSHTEQASPPVKLPNGANENSIRISSDMGNRQRSIGGNKGGTSWHAGIDVSNPKGGNVYAIRSGTVMTAGSGNANSYVDIKHSDGTMYRYMHNNATVRVGQRVPAGHKIATTHGIRYTPHLHLEFHAEGKKWDPIPPLIKDTGKNVYSTVAGKNITYSRGSDVWRGYNTAPPVPVSVGRSNRVNHEQKNNEKIGGPTISISSPISSIKRTESNSNEITNVSTAIRLSRRNNKENLSISDRLVALTELLLDTDRVLSIPVMDDTKIIPVPISSKHSINTNDLRL